MYKLRDTLLGTYTGHTLDVVAPLPEDIYIIDIAHHLAYQCRYGGATRKFYSVAEHCVIVSEHAPPGLKRAALLHDAAEAYVTDIPRGLKHSIDMAGYRAIESVFQAAIEVRFGLKVEHPAIDDIDKRLILDETKELITGWERYWTSRPGMKPVGAKIRGWTPDVAERMFLDRFFALFPEWFDGP